MKNNLKLVYNPFDRIAGWQAFGLGMVILLLTTWIGYLNEMYFCGLEIKVYPGLTLKNALMLQGVGLAAQVVVMYIFALIATRTVRFQDILGTITLAKYPLLIVSLAGFMMDPNVITVDGTLDFMKTTPFIVGTLIMIAGTILEVALMYNAFRISTGTKGYKCNVLFIAALILAEVLAVYCMYQIF